MVIANRMPNINASPGEMNGNSVRAAPIGKMTRAGRLAAFASPNSLRQPEGALPGSDAGALAVGSTELIAGAPRDFRDRRGRPAGGSAPAAVRAPLGVC